MSCCLMCRRREHRFVPWFDLLTHQPTEYVSGNWLISCVFFRQWLVTQPLRKLPFVVEATGPITVMIEVRHSVVCSLHYSSFHFIPLYWVLISYHLCRRLAVGFTVIYLFIYLRISCVTHARYTLLIVMWTKTLQRRTERGCSAVTDKNKH